MRIGLVGFGDGGRRFHLPYILAATEWDLIGVVTKSPERRAQLEADAPGVPAFADLDELVDAGVDVVVLTTPPETRRGLVLRALERGVHTVADKPFAPTVEGARELSAAAERAGKILTVYHNRRWDTDIRTLMGVIASGALGSIWRLVNRLDLDEPGSLEVGPAHGLLRDLGAHLVDQAVQLLGPVARVDGRLDWVGEGEERVDAGFVLGLHHLSGAHSTVTASKINRLAERELMVYADNGSYTSRMSDVQTAAVLRGERPIDSVQWGLENPERWGILRTAGGERPVPSLKGDYTEFYRQLHSAVMGDTEPPVTLGQAVHTIEILDAARLSAIEGRSVTLGDAALG